MTRMILMTIDDRLLAEATPADKCLMPDKENFWNCDDCGMGYGLPPGKIIREETYYIVTDGRCVKCGGNKFAKSMLANK